MPDGSVLYQSTSGSSWTSSFVLSIPGGAQVEVRPWLCPRTAEAVEAARAGRLAYEQRTVALEDGGYFRTNGFFGEAFPTECHYASSSDTGGGVSALQDGPSSCSEPARAQTHVQLLGPDGEVLSSPDVCVARYGAAKGEFTSQLGLVLERSADEPATRAFSLSLNHCLRAEQAAPLSIRAQDVISSGCAQEAGFLSLGLLGKAGKPKAYQVSDGTWAVETFSRDGTAMHRSTLDLDFTAQDGSTLRIVGQVVLPQILF